MVERYASKAAPLTITLGTRDMKKVYMNSRATLCVLPSLFPAYMLFLYKDPGAANFGWEMFLGFGLFWGSVAFAIILGIGNLIILLERPRTRASQTVGLVYLGLNLLTLGLACALLR